MSDMKYEYADVQFLKKGNVFLISLASWSLIKHFQRCVSGTLATRIHNTYIVDAFRFHLQ